MQLFVSDLQYLLVTQALSFLVHSSDNGHKMKKSTSTTQIKTCNSDLRTKQGLTGYKWNLSGLILGF